MSTFLTPASTSAIGLMALVIVRMVNVIAGFTPCRSPQALASTSCGVTAATARARSTHDEARPVDLV